MNPARVRPSRARDDPRVDLPGDARVPPEDHAGQPPDRAKKQRRRQRRRHEPNAAPASAAARVRSQAAEAPASTAPATTTSSHRQHRRQRQHPHRAFRHVQQAPEDRKPHGVAASSQALMMAKRRITGPSRTRRGTVTTIGVVEADTPGTYIGVTCAGIARNVPGVTIFSRYQNSTRPPGRPSWKKTARSSRNSWRPPHGRARLFSSGYRLSSAMVSAPAGSGSSMRR